MKTVSVLLLASLLGASFQVYANTPKPTKDTLQSLVKESVEQSKSEKELFDKIADTTRPDGQDLRCVEVPKLMKKRISINERSIPLVPKENADELKQQNKIIAEKIQEAKTTFGCE